MANEQHIQELQKTLNKIREETEIIELQDRIDELRSRKDDYDELRQETRDLICEYICEEVSMRKGRKSIEGSLTIKDGDINNYGSSVSASIRNLRKYAEELSEEVGDEKVVDWLERAGEKYSDLDKETKTLITDDSTEYDAVTLKLTGYSSKLKLVDTLGKNGACGGDKVDLEACCVEKLEPILRNLPHIKDVVYELEVRINDEMNQMEKLRDDIEKEAN